MKDQPSPEVKDQAFAEFRSDIDKAIDHGVEDHESSMTKMGFLFLGIFVGVIALAAVLPWSVCDLAIRKLPEGFWPPGGFAVQLFCNPCR